MSPSEQTPTPRFSCAIVHRNGSDLLLDTIASLKAATDPMRDEIIVVDNGSRDESLTALRAAHPDVRVVVNGCNHGFARANNQAIRCARGRYVLLLNNDARPAPDVLDRFEQLFDARPRAAVVAAQLVDGAGRMQRSHALLPSVCSELGLARLRRARSLPETNRVGVNQVEVESVVGACLAARTEAIRDCGPLDEDFFFYFEETEWCHRFRTHGWQVWLDREARVRHDKGTSTRGLRCEAQIEMLRSRLTYYRKVFSPPIARLLSTFRVTRLAINFLVHAATAVITLGAVAGPRARVGVYGAQLAWLARGCPESAGLPDKCPRGHNGTTR